MTFNDPPPQRREPKFTKAYRLALLVDAIGGGLCPKHGEYLGHGQYGLSGCPFCDIEEHFEKEKRLSQSVMRLEVK